MPVWFSSCALWHHVNLAKKKKTTKKQKKATQATQSHRLGSDYSSVCNHLALASYGIFLASTFSSVKKG